MADTRNITKERIGLFIYACLFGIIINAQPLFFNTDATDSIRAYGSTQAQEGSGRFIGHILDVIFERMGFYQPFRFINVLIYIIFLAAFAVLTVMILDIGKRSLALLTASVIMSCAMNSGELAYYYVSHMYGFSLFISGLACWLMLKRRAVLIPALLLFISLGIYQAFFPTVILLIFLHELLRLFDDEADIKAWLFSVLRYMLIVIEALAIYIIANRIYLTLSGSAMSGYLNMSENVLPSYTPSMILKLIGESYSFFFGLPFTERYFLSDNIIMRLSLGFFIGLTIFELIYALMRTRDVWKRLLILLLFIVLPIFINLPMFMQGSVGERFSLNWYFIFIAPMAVFCRIPGLLEAKGRRCMGMLYSLMIICASFSIAYGAYRNVNIYTSYLRTQEIAENVVLDIENRLGECEGFSLEEELVFIGSLDTQSLNKSFFNVEYDEFINKVFNRDHSSIFRRYALHNYDIITPDDERVQALSLEDFNSLSETELADLRLFCIKDIHGGFETIHSGLEEIRKMPSYPDAGCIKKIGDVVICKLSE